MVEFFFLLFFTFFSLNTHFLDERFGKYEVDRVVKFVGIINAWRLSSNIIFIEITFLVSTAMEYCK
jgi:hypothetical protein